MENRKKIFVIVGSAKDHSANEKLVEYIVKLCPHYDFEIFTQLKSLPHFDPLLSADNPPSQIVELRSKIEKADGVIICTPEYVFSIPSGLKNAIEWCVSTTVFSDKPTGLITASADGSKGHDELKLIMKTLMAKFTDESTLLIRGINGKINAAGEITDGRMKEDIYRFMDAFGSGLKGFSD